MLNWRKPEPEERAQVLRFAEREFKEQKGQTTALCAAIAAGIIVACAGVAFLVMVGYGMPPAQTWITVLIIAAVVVVLMIFYGRWRDRKIKEKYRMICNEGYMVCPARNRGKRIGYERRKVLFHRRIPEREVYLLAADSGAEEDIQEVEVSAKVYDHTGPGTEIILVRYDHHSDKNVIDAAYLADSRIDLDEEY